jgi:peptide/nickel transport system substrate-binding protein
MKMKRFALAVATSVVAFCSINSLAYAQARGGVIDVATVGEPPTLARLA